MRLPSYVAVGSIVSAVLFCACGDSGGGGSNSGASSTQGSMTFALTDAASDDVTTFVAEIRSLKLKRDSGATLELLAAPIEVDFAALADSSQLFGISSLPAGTCTQAEITFDLSNATCVLAGESVPAAVVDLEDQPFTAPITLAIDLEDAPLDVLGGRNRVCELELDLDQSIVADVGANRVRVEPVFVLRVDPADAKPLVAAGKLVSVDPAQREVEVRLVARNGAELGLATLRTSAATKYCLDGQTYGAVGGLAQLAQAPVGEWIEVSGSPNPDRAALNALDLRAGSGTWNGGLDQVDGHVVARNGGPGSDPVLTVLGDSSDATHGQFLFNTHFTVSTSFVGLGVVADGSNAPLDPDHIGVGQHVRIFGQLSGTTLDTNVPNSLARLLRTSLRGHIAAAPSGGAMELDLARVGLVPVDQFDWSGSGLPPANPAQLTIDLQGAAPVPPLALGDAAALRGRFAAVDDAGDDFAADEAADHAKLPVLLMIRDLNAGMLVNVLPRPHSIRVTLSGAPQVGEVALVDHGFTGQTALPTGTLVIVPHGATTHGLVRRKHIGVDQHSLEFEVFSDEVKRGLRQGRLAQYSALGFYDPAASTFEVAVVSAVLD